MGSNPTQLPKASAQSSDQGGQIQISGILDELNSLIGQGRTEIAQGFFSALVRATGVGSGQMFLVNDAGTLDYCLALRDGQLKEEDCRTDSDPYTQGLAGQAYRQRQGILITEADKDPRGLFVDQSADLTAIGSALATPLLLRTTPLGAIALLAQKSQPFNSHDLTAMTNLAGYASVLLENAGLQNALTGNQQRLDTLRRTIHTVTASLDIEQALQTLLTELTGSIGYSYGVIMLLDNAELRPTTVTGFSKQMIPELLEATKAPALFQILDERRIVTQEDAANNSLLHSAGLPESLGSWAAIPLLMKGEALGLVIVADPVPRPKDDQRLSTITAFADYVSVAVKNQRLVQETERRVRELAFLGETGQAITSTRNLDRILQLLLERVRGLLQIDATSIALRDEQTGKIVFEAASGSGAAEIIGVELDPGQGIAGWVAETGKPLLVRDVYADPRFFEGIDRKTGMTTHTVLCIPIVLKGHIVGVIEALNPERVPFDEQAIGLLNALSGLAASAIENARLFAQVRSAEARYEGLFEDSVNPIIISDLQGNVVDANRNACALFGQAKEALLGTNLARFPSPAGSFDFTEPIARIQAGEEIVLETEIAAKGQWQAVEIRGKQIVVEGTPLIQWLSRDISAELELEQTRDDMVRMIVHDLRNPLANIMNSLDVLYDVIMEDDDSVSRDELLTIARRSGQRMHQLISSILDISRLETGQAILETRPTDLRALIHEASEFIKPQTEIRDITLTLELDPNLPEIEIDRDMILRVVLNLLDNASKFTQIGGAIQVAARKREGSLEVAIADNGPGIPTDQLQTVFDKFTRVRRKDGPEGTGLGLAFCKLAVESHGGRIWAESIIGQGTTFRFTLPTVPTHSG